MNPDPATVSRWSHRLFARGLPLAVCLFACNCGRKERGEFSEAGPRPLAPINSLEGAGGGLYREFADSPIHWQPWGAEAIRQARQSKRLIFCVLGRAQDPGFFELMGELEADEATVGDINRDYLPVMVDLDVCREFQHVARNLAIELRQPLVFPVLIWMDCNARPFSTTPRPLYKGAVIELFRQTHVNAQVQWQADLKENGEDLTKGHVFINNQLDHQRRLQRMTAAYAADTYSDDALQVAAEGVAQMLPNYDEYSHQFEDAGSVLPSSLIACIARAAMCEGLDAQLRQRSRKVIESIGNHLLRSPMIDPLDGGAFSYREGASWNLPAFSRNCVSQIEFATALLRCDQAIKLPRSKEAALGVISNLERECITPEGLFSLAPTRDTSALKWTWSTAEVIEVLGAEDAAWWIEMAEMKDLGNLTDELAAAEDLFRRNTLAIKKTPDEMASSLSISRETFLERLEKARASLLAVRNSRFVGSSHNHLPDLASSFSMVSLYVLAHQVTGDPLWRDKALSLHAKCRDHFVSGGRLRPLTFSNGGVQTSARAQHHALALLACVDLAAIAPDEFDALAVASSHYQALSRAHLQDGLLLECDPAFNFINLPIVDARMIFGVSTQGLLMSVEARAVGGVLEMSEELSEQVRRMPLKAGNQALVHMDLIQAVLERHSLKSR